MSPSTIDRPLMLRARADVLVASVRVAGSPRWIITDPVTLKHFDLSEEEYALLTALGDGASLRDLQRAFEEQFAPKRISVDEVWEYVSRLHKEGLAVSTGEGQGDQLLERDRQHQRDQLAWSWTRLLAIKLPGVNPDRMLDLLYPPLGWVFGKLGLALACCLMLLALAAALTNFGALMESLPGLDDLTTPRGLIALAVTAVGVKVLHELGHALACRRFGGRVHEMGVLLLAFAPALYCDVSDMWRLPSKWKRVAVSAAGIYVELCLASIAVLVWSFSDNSLLQLASLNVMIVCTIGTLLLNANPLLRYDGYYILSDLTDTPNLWQRSRDAAAGLWRRWFDRSPAQRCSAGPWWLPLYGVASMAYMVVVVASVLWMVSVTLRPYRLESLAYLVGAVVVAGVLAAPARRLVGLLQNPIARRRVRPARAVIAVACLCLLLGGLWNLPWRHAAQGHATVTPHDPREVVATVAGRLVEVVKDGQLVEPGQVIARLENPEVQRELHASRAAVQAAQLRVRQLEALRSRDKQSSDNLPAAQAELKNMREQLATMELEAERLVLRAPRRGVVLRLATAQQANIDQTTLARWSGSLLDAENHGAWVEPGQVVCQLVQPANAWAEVMLEEDDIERVRVGQAVQLALRQSPGQIGHGTVVEIAQRAVRQEDSAPRYSVRVELTNAPPLVINGAGRAKINTGDTKLGPLLVTRLRQMFRLP